MTEGEWGDPEFDPDVRAVLDQIDRRWWVPTVVVFAVVVGSGLAAVVAGDVGLLPTLAGMTLVWAGAFGRFLVVDDEETLRTEKPPAAVREEFLRPVNPSTAMLLDRCDAVAERETDGDGTALDLTFRRTLRHPVTLPVVTATTDEADHDVAVRFGDEEGFAVSVTAEATADGTRVHTAIRDRRLRPVDELRLWLLERQERRLLEAFDYDVVDSTGEIRLGR